VETKRFFGSFVHVIFTQQTCGQRSNRAAESKRRALGNYFSERICYIFLTSKCRGDRDLGLCTTPLLFFSRNGKTRFFLRRNTCFPRQILNNHTWPHSLLFNFFSAGCALDARSADGCDTNSSRGVLLLTVLDEGFFRSILLGKVELKSRP